MIRWMLWRVVDITAMLIIILALMSLYYYNSSFFHIDERQPAWRSDCELYSCSSAVSSDPRRHAPVASFHVHLICTISKSHTHPRRNDTCPLFALVLLRRLPLPSRYVYDETNYDESKSVFLLLLQQQHYNDTQTTSNFLA